MNTAIQVDAIAKQEAQKIFQRAYNEETRKAIEDTRRGIGLTKAYHSAAELFAALDAETHSDIFP